MCKPGGCFFSNQLKMACARNLEALIVFWVNGWKICWVFSYCTKFQTICFSLNYVHTVTFSSVFNCVFTLKRMQTLSIYDRSCSLFNTLEIFSFGPCEQGVKTIKWTKTFLKTLENDARVHAHSLIAVLRNWEQFKICSVFFYTSCSLYQAGGKLEK